MVIALSPAERARLEAEARRLVEFGRGAVHPDGGFGWLDDAGALTPGKPVEAWITSRMTHCFALAGLRGDLQPAEAHRLVDHGVRALLGPLRDVRHGGWHSGVADGRPVTEAKEGYAHAFVVLAAASATAAGHPDAPGLLAEALDVLDRRFWREDDGLMVDRCSSDWSEVDPYRGVNANMHLVEALLAAGDVTGERRWVDRAGRIVERVVHGFARDRDWRLPEHYDERWQVQLDYNLDVPADPFRPYGVTVGHLFEWARLALHTRTALGGRAPDWLLADAQALRAAAAERGWSVDGAPGFVYTTDFADRPVVRERMHWVAAEAIASAWTLHRDTGAPAARADFEAWWDYVEGHLVDREGGSWRHELGPDNLPSSTVWSGKPDIYHAYQATVLPLLPEAASFAGALLH
ncbi:MAG TPA: AGE family epimerase/isomerase [Nocardioides sp.]|nr:AGE family epimerase/isomerase [Nocardioides sp.]